MVIVPMRRQQNACVCQRARSMRRACVLLSVVRSTTRIEPRLAVSDAPLVVVVNEFATLSTSDTATGAPRCSWCVGAAWWAQCGPTTSCSMRERTNSN